jgi:hypothetical protein
MKGERGKQTKMRHKEEWAKTELSGGKEGKEV